MYIIYTVYILKINSRYILDYSIDITVYYIKYYIL